VQKLSEKRRKVLGLHKPRIPLTDSVAGKLSERIRKNGALINKRACVCSCSTVSASRAVLGLYVIKFLNTIQLVLLTSQFTICCRRFYFEVSLFSSEKELLKRAIFFVFESVNGQEYDASQSFNFDLVNSHGPGVNYSYLSSLYSKNSI